MTPIDVMAGMILAACVDGLPVTTQSVPRIDVTYYDCPLIGRKAAFLVWRLVCSEDEQYATAIMDARTHRGFVVNQFRGIDTAFLDVEAFPVYAPRCESETMLAESRDQEFP